MESADAGGPVHGGRLMAESLRSHGVEHLFTLGGGHIVELLDGCIDAGVRVVDMRHEGAATLAALGWALATGSTGVAAVTAGPGFTNALTGFVDAALGHAPQVLVGGRTGLKLRGRGAVMDFDQRAMVEPVAKWTSEVHAAPMIPRVTEEALHRARSGRPGAVYLDIPHDVFMTRLRQPERTWGFPPPAGGAAPSDADVDRVVAALERAERPVVLCGSGAFWAGAGPDIARMCEAARVPVTTTSAARGLVPDSHPWCLGSLVHAGIALASADTVVVLGSAFNGNLLYGGPPLFNDDQVVVQVDVRPEELGGNRPPQIGVHADVARLAAAVADARPAAPEARSAWLGRARALVGMSRESWDEQVDGAAGARVHPGALAREVAAFAREECGDAVTLVADGGDILTWALAYLYAEGPGRLLSTTTALGTLGVGLPFALAARLARPAEPVILITGDGAFGLAAMELESAARHGLPVVVVVANNAGWGDVRHHQREVFGREVGSALAPTRYDLLAEALGGHGERVATVDGLRPALRRALASGLPAVVDVETDGSVISQLLRVMMSLHIM